MEEQEVGVVVHYFGKISVGVIQLKGELQKGDTIHIKGTHDDFTQTIESMRIDYDDVEQAKDGDKIGIKVIQPVHANDKVYKVIE